MIKHEEIFFLGLQKGGQKGIILSSAEANSSDYLEIQKPRSHMHRRPGSAKKIARRPARNKSSTIDDGDTKSDSLYGPRNQNEGVDVTVGLRSVYDPIPRLDHHVGYEQRTSFGCSNPQSSRVAVTQEASRGCRYRLDRIGYKSASSHRQERLAHGSLARLFGEYPLFAGYWM